jgi:hypothetical protein
VKEIVREKCARRRCAVVRAVRRAIRKGVWVDAVISDCVIKGQGLSHYRVRRGVQRARRHIKRNGTISATRLCSTRGTMRSVN